MKKVDRLSNNVAEHYVVIFLEFVCLGGGSDQDRDYRSDEVHSGRRHVEWRYNGCRGNK